MIPEYKFYHGAVLADIIDRAASRVLIDEHFEAGRLLNYVIDGEIGVQIKYSTARLRPWSFSFPPMHMTQLGELKLAYSKSFLALVCHRDGFACIPTSSALELLAKVGSSSSWLRVTRRKREMYRVFGPNGELSGRVRTTSEPIVDELQAVR